MLTSTSGLSRLRPFYTGDTRELFHALLNAVSAAEASLALDVLRSSVPEKALVTACNLREVLGALPASPFTMAVDEETLIKAAGLEKHIATLKKDLPDGIELVVTTAGNLVLDLIVRDNGEKYFWTPIPVTEDYVNPAVVELVMTSDYLLDEVIDLVKCMGVVFNPTFYFSIEDFTLEYASDVFEGVSDLFGPAISPARIFWEDFNRPCPWTERPHRRVV